MRHKITFFERRRDGHPSPISTRIPWRARRRERAEQRNLSASQSDFNSIRINTVDYPPDLLRKYDDERINISSDSQPKAERDRQSHPSNTNELERVQSEERNSRLKLNERRRPGECLFITSGFRVHPNTTSNAKEMLSATDGLGDGHNDPLFPFPEQSREGFFLRGKGWLLILFILIALTTVIGLSWFYTCHNNLKTDAVHALVTAHPLARLLGLTRIVDNTSDPRYLWINHVVKNDDNQIVIAETFESRLNAEISPLLEKYTDKIWGDPSSTSMTCHGGDRVMVAFSMAKAGSIPASVTYEMPCTNQPSSRNCIVKKHISDVRDLVVRLPAKSSRYMHAVRLEIESSSKENSKNSSEVRHIQDLGLVSGQFRVELSDASRLALQRYCGQNPLAYSADLLTEPVTERNTRLINLFELKRLYGLLSSQPDMQNGGSIRGSNAWDNRMLSTIVIDPLEHSRHSLAPIHVQQLLSRLHSVNDSQTLHRARELQFPRIAVASPQEDILYRPSMASTQHVSERKTDTATSTLNPSSHLASPSSSNPSPSPSISSLSPVQTDTMEQVQPFIAAPASSTSAVERPSHEKSPQRLQRDTDSAHLRRTTEPIAPSSLTNGAVANKTGNQTAERTMRAEDGKRSVTDPGRSVAHDGATPAGKTAKRKSTTESDRGENSYYHAPRNLLVSSQGQSSLALSEHSTAFPASNKESALFAQEQRTDHQRAPEASSRSILSTTRNPHFQGHDKISPSASPQPRLSPGTSIPGQNAPFAPKLTKPVSSLSSGPGVGLQETQRKFPALLTTGAKIDSKKHARTAGITMRSKTNTARASVPPNSVIQLVSGRTRHSPKQVPSRSAQSGLFRSQEASSLLKRTFSSTRKQSSPVQAFSPSAKKVTSTSSLAAISPTQRKASRVNKRLISPAFGSPLAAQKKQSSMQRTLTSTGAVLSPTNDGMRLTKGGVLAMQNRKPNKRKQLTRRPRSPPVHPRGATPAQMTIQGQKQSDMRVWLPRSAPGRYPRQTGFLEATNSQTGARPRYP